MLNGLYKVMDRIAGLQKKFGNIQNKYTQSYNHINNSLSIKKSQDINKTVNKENFNQILDEVRTEITDKEKNYLKDIDKIISEKAKKYNLTEELIRSVIKVESNFNPDAVSPKGAKGLMQLMPDTAVELGVNNIFDAEENIEGGAKYLRQLLNRYNGDLKTTLAAYNAGMGNVEKYKGVPPFNETTQYITQVLKNLPGTDDV